MFLRNSLLIFLFLLTGILSSCKVDFGSSGTGNGDGYEGEDLGATEPSGLGGDGGDVDDPNRPSIKSILFHQTGSTPECIISENPLTQVGVTPLPETYVIYRQNQIGDDIINYEKVFSRCEGDSLGPISSSMVDTSKINEENPRYLTYRNILATEESIITNYGQTHFLACKGEILVNSQTHPIEFDMYDRGLNQDFTKYARFYTGHALPQSILEEHTPEVRFYDLGKYLGSYMPSDYWYSFYHEEYEMFVHSQTMWDAIYASDHDFESKKFEMTIVWNNDLNISNTQISCLRKDQQSLHYVVEIPLSDRDKYEKLYQFHINGNQSSSSAHSP